MFLLLPCAVHFPVKHLICPAEFCFGHVIHPFFYRIPGCRFCVLWPPNQNYFEIAPCWHMLCPWPYWQSAAIPALAPLPFLTMFLARRPCLYISQKLRSIASLLHISSSCYWQSLCVCHGRENSSSFQEIETSCISESSKICLIAPVNSFRNGNRIRTKGSESLS